MQYLRDVSEMSCGTTAIMQMRLQQDSSQQDSSNHRNVQIFGRYFCCSCEKTVSAVPLHNKTNQSLRLLPHGKRMRKVRLHDNKRQRKEYANCDQPFSTDEHTKGKHTERKRRACFHLWDWLLGVSSEARSQENPGCLSAEPFSLFLL